MGSDKAQLIYHGKPQKEHVKNLLENLGIATYYSVAKGSEQPDEIPDKLPNLGPLGGVFSAFSKDPNSAWFVLAVVCCRWPLLGVVGRCWLLVVGCW